MYFFRDSSRRMFFFFVLLKLIFERILHSGYWKRIFLCNGEKPLHRYFTWKLFSTSGKRHYYEWKPIFKDRICSCRWKLILWLIETIFFLPFGDARATASFIFAYSGNVFLNTFRLVERDIFWVVETLFFIYFSDISASDLFRCQTFMPAFSSSYGNIVLKRILHSEQWKRIFRLVETILFQYLKYNFHWK